MTLSAEKADFEELARTLGDIERTMSSFHGEADRSDGNGECRKLVQSFHTTAAMLGLDDLARLGQGLEAVLGGQRPVHGECKVFPSLGPKLRKLSDELETVEDIATIGELVSSIRDLIEGGEEPFLADKLSTDVKDPVSVGELNRLERIVNGLGGTLTCKTDDTGSRAIVFQFEATPGNIEKIETLLSPWDPDPGAGLAPSLGSDNPKIQRIIENIKEFMKALSEGLWARSQEILLELSEQHSKSDLYREIGSLARQLHSALKEVTETLDPSLKELVELKLPDSGTRLEHILELTENAANVTLDNVEVIQRRSQGAETDLANLRELLSDLQAISPQAQEKLDRGIEMITAVSSAFEQNREGLVSILTAQDYQDLTGQIIMKIITLLKDLEKRLINVVRVFGGRISAPPVAEQEELYGPAHKGKEEALHSQDDVDSLLAEFGF
jgi:chemotaxis protein CheZ